MRIGEFSKKHNITHDTVRHYIDMGLLIPKKSGHHYRFDDSHGRDLDKIIELKNLEFSLKEIQEILKFHRLAGRSSKEYNKYYLEMLEDKKVHIDQCRKKYEDIQLILDKKIEDLSSNKRENKKLLGINIDSLDILSCPKCCRNINISDGSIENNMVTEGNVVCRCGYMAYIKNGIYIGGSDKKGLDLKKQIPDKLDFMKYASTEFINFYYNGMSKIINGIKRYTKIPEYILELENCSGTFLMQYMDELDEKSTYILINDDQSRLENLKKTLELNSNHDNFLFICEEYDYLPVKSNSIDIIIDHWMTRNYVEYKGGFLLGELGKTLKEGGLLIGAYPYLTDKDTNKYAKSLEEKGYFSPEFIWNKYESLGFKKGISTEMGPIIEKDSYDEERKNRKLYLNVYSAVK